MLIDYHADKVQHPGNGASTHDVTELFNTAVIDGFLNNIIQLDDTASLYSNDADSTWLMEQLQHDIAHHPYNIWSK